MQLSQQTSEVCNEPDVFEQILTLDGKDILELGCGKADLTRLIATTGKGRKIIATEVDEIQHIQNLLIDDLPNVRFSLAGSEAIPLKNECIDIVFMFKSLHHVPIEKMETALNEINRVLKPGGFAYISEPVFKGDFNEILCLFHNEEEVRKAAFKTIEKSVNNKKFVLVNELFFNVQRFYKDFQEFEQRIIKVTHSNHKLSAELQKKVKQQFSKNMHSDGAQFLIPIRVDLIQKNY